jgi:hypothetical protein
MRLTMAAAPIPAGTPALAEHALQGLSFSGGLVRRHVQFQTFRLT